MKVTAVETTPVVVTLPQPIGSALGQITCFGCILVTLRTDAGVTGENLVFTLNDRRTKVLMGYDGRHTACVSTQAGCAMGCVFCATGQMGFVRHLRPGEIVAQVLHARRVLEATMPWCPRARSGPWRS